MPFSKAKLSSFYGVLIKTNAFGEGHSLLTIIEQARGKIEVFSFGSSKENSRRRSSLLVASLLSGILARKSDDDPYSLKEASSVKTYDHITSSYKKISYLYLLFEILDRMLLSGNPFHQFGLFLDTLNRMNNEEDFEKYFFYTAVVLMQNEGLLPSFQDKCSAMEELKGETGKSLKIGEGTSRFICDIQNSVRINPDTPDYKEIAFISKVKLSPAVVGDLLRFISRVIKSIYGKELASMSMFIQ